MVLARRLVAVARDECLETSCARHKSSNTGRLTWSGSETGGIISTTPRARARRDVARALTCAIRPFPAARIAATSSRRKFPVTTDVRGDVGTQLPEALLPLIAAPPAQLMREFHLHALLQLQAGEFVPAVRPRDVRKAVSSPIRFPLRVGRARADSRPPRVLLPLAANGAAHGKTHLVERQNPTAASALSICVKVRRGSVAKTRASSGGGPNVRHLRFPCARTD